MKRALRAIALAMAGIGAVLCFRFHIFQLPLAADNEIYFFLSERAASGVPPHVSMADPKTQLSTLGEAAAIALGRRLSVDDVTSFRVFSIASVAVSLALTVALAAGLAMNPGEAPSLFALLAGALAGGALLFADGLFIEGASGGRPQTFVVTFLLWAHWALVRRRYVQAGVAAGCAFACWQPAGIVLGSVGLACLLSDRQPLLRAVKVAVGAVVVAVLYEAYFVATGSVGEQLFQEFLLPTGSIHQIPDLAASFWFIATEVRTWERFPHLLPTAFLVAVAALWANVASSPRDAWRRARARPDRTSVWLASQLGFLFTLYEHQAHPDLLLIQPYFAVIAGWMGALLVRRLLVRAAGGASTNASLRVVAALGGLMLVLGTRHAWMRAAMFDRQTVLLSDQRTTADGIGLLADHRGSVWVLGPVHLLALQHRDNWVGYGFFWDDLAARIDLKSYRPLRDGRMPEVIVTGRGLVTGVSGWRREEYEEMEMPLLAVQKLRVFLRRDSADAAKPATAPSSPS